MAAGSANRIVRFLAGLVGALLVTAGFLLWRGQSMSARLEDLGPEGLAAGLVLAAVTIVLPGGILGLVGGGRWRAALLGGLVVPLGLLAVDGLVRVDAEGSRPGPPDPVGRSLLNETLRTIWSPVSGLPRTASPAASGEAAPAATEEVAELRRRVIALETERDGLRVATKRLEEFGPPEVQRRMEEQGAEVAEARRRLAEAESSLQASRAMVESLQGKLRAAETGILEGSREIEDLKRENLGLKDAAQAARDDAVLVKKQLEEKLAELTARDAETRLAELQAKAFTPVGVLMSVDDPRRDRGVAIRTSVDARRITGAAFVLSPTGEAVAVIRCRVGKGEELAGTILVTAPARDPMPGDVVYARLR